MGGDKKCSFKDGMEIEVFGISVNPCIYEEIETHHNVTVHVMRCKKCGHIELEWSKEDGDE